MLLLIVLLAIPATCNDAHLLESQSTPDGSTSDGGSESDECPVCIVDSLLAMLGVPQEKIMTYLIVAAAVVAAMFLTIIGLSIGICCIKSRYNRKVWNLHANLDTEQAYAQFLEFQQRFKESQPTGSARQAMPMVVTYPPV